MAKVAINKFDGAMTKGASLAFARATDPCSLHKRES